mgnify:CR=1 FL=1
MPSGDGRWLRDGDEIHSPVPGSPPVTINQSAVSTATHTGKRTRCLRFFSVTPRRDEGYHITLLSKPRLTLCAGQFAVGCCDGVRMTVAGWLVPSPFKVAHSPRCVCSGSLWRVCEWLQYVAVKVARPPSSNIPKYLAADIPHTALQCGAFLRPPQGAHYGCSPPSNAASAAALPTAD